MLRRLQGAEYTRLAAQADAQPVAFVGNARQRVVGIDGDGLPIGLQIVGPMFGDALVLRAARAYESVRPIERPAFGKA